MPALATATHLHRRARPPASRRAVVVGAGPAGLAAAEVLAEGGLAVAIHESMPNPARKFGLAGRGGLILTHSEPLDVYLSRYGPARVQLEDAIHAVPPQALRDWCEDLGIETFIGSSGRIFPKSMKASPLLRAWLARLGSLGVELVSRSRWVGWEDDCLVFDTPAGRLKDCPDVAIFALGGASWPRLGSAGDWQEAFALRGAMIEPLRASNSGFLVHWSDVFRARFAGQPIKGARFGLAGSEARGEAVLTDYGIEGGAIYALSAALRDAVETRGVAALTIDLFPDIAAEGLAGRLTARRGDSIANRLRKLGLSHAAANLVREDARGPALPAAPLQLAERIKAVRLSLVGAAPIERAIATAGGISWSSLNPDYSLEPDSRTFVCGEMLDWEAPTGGYLLQACFATGRAAARGALARLRVG
jgi:uncharacterized flavoprotein (TIGR03862 family)